jgi:hypothetical protein
MDKAIEKAVRSRARGLCEYCHLPQSLYTERFHADHIIARQHGGLTKLDNPAFCCLECNQRKGPNIAGIDRLTKQLVRLFHPRNDVWSDHFAWNGASLLGRTAIGRATVSLLDINRPPRVVVRQTLIEEGVFHKFGESST